METRKLQVLIVDDHAAWRKTLRMYLASLPNLEVMGAVSDGYAALDLCQYLKPDLVLLDINMPGMDGYETAQTLLNQYPGMWIIGISAEVTPESQQLAQAAGFKAVLPKDMLLDYLNPNNLRPLAI